MIICNDFEQGSKEWLEARLGIPTASEFSKIITSTGTKSKQTDAYKYKLAGESLTGLTDEGFKSAWMERGNELEAEAREYYAYIEDVEVEQVGIIYLDESRELAGSPDGLIGTDGMIEIKCPATHTHVEYLDKNKLPAKYKAQVQGNLYISGYKWCDFMSYHPSAPPLIVRVERDDEFIEQLKVHMESFLEKLNIVKSNLTKAA